MGCAYGVGRRHRARGEPGRGVLAKQLVGQLAQRYVGPVPGGASALVVGFRYSQSAEVLGGLPKTPEPNTIDHRP